MIFKRAIRGAQLAKALAKTGLFDEGWYRETYADAIQRGETPLKAFIARGAEAGHRPNAYFDPTYYGARAGVEDPIEAILHYAGEGWRAGLNPSRAFLLEAYLRDNGDLREQGVEPLAHFLAHGRQEGRKAIGLDVDAGTGEALEARVEAVRQSPLFDAAFYLAEYAQGLTEEERQDPARHYVTTGENIGYRPNAYFDPAYYLAQAPEAADAGSLLLHYRDTGWRQGHNPSRRFDTRLYQEVYGAGEDRDPLSHYLQQGARDGNVPIDAELTVRQDETETRARMVAVAKTGLFDVAWYREANVDISRHPVSPLEHYVRNGVREGRWANRYFDTRWYARRYREQIGDELPLVHYAREGFKVPHDPCATFDAGIYLRLNPDLTPGEDDALRHYLKVGRAEGRTLPNPEKFTSDALYYLSLPVEEQDALRMAIAATGLFLSAWYQSENASLLKGGLDPIDHYLIFGEALELRPNPYFDTVWYKGWHKVEIGEKHPLLYYAEEGAALGHWPSADFDPEAYVAANPDARSYPGSALLHYVRRGYQEGRPVPAAKSGDNAATYIIEGGEKLLSPIMEGMVDFERRPLAPTAHAVSADALDIHWVMPDFAAGGGGHMTIFRMVSHLERQGHKVTLWINAPSMHRTPEEARETIRKHFKFVCAEVKFVTPAFPTEARGDAIVATDCWSVWPVLSAPDFLARFYFVQDFEPYFYPMGGRYLAAELTYKQDLFCLCASPWLSKRLSEDYGRDTSHFWLAADQKLYKPLEAKPKNDVPRIAFYSRISTDRRAVELGLLALKRLAERGVSFNVDFFGGNQDIRKAPFAFTDHGVAAPAELAALFGTADIGVVFSATNYSLVPQEMMACGLPIVEMDGESTRAIYPEDVVSWAAPDPVAIADAIEALLADDARRKAQAAAASEWVSGFSWHGAAVTVEAAIKAQVTEAVESGRASGCSLMAAPKVESAPFASVVIPTYNAGPGLDAVLEAVCSQHTPWPYEVLVIDSGSTDETLDIVARHPKVRLHHLEKGTFNHGDTRNLGASLTRGDYIAFLTHDALPADDAWLFNLVMAVADRPTIAGGFGKHLAYPEASAFTKRDLDAHFALMAKQPLVLSARTDARRYAAGDEGWHQILHFYSDNNSCFRRRVWEKIPYRRVAFGEDQLWAHDIIEAGYEKVYAAQAVVYHSHDFDEAETHERSQIESSFFRHFFGYALIGSQEELEKTLAELNQGDEDWGRRHGVDDADIAERKALNAARLRGYLDGYLADTTGLFEDAAE